MDPNLYLNSSQTPWQNQLYPSIPQSPSTPSNGQGVQYTGQPSSAGSYAPGQTAYPQSAVPSTVTQPVTVTPTSMSYYTLATNGSSINGGTNSVNSYYPQYPPSLYYKGTTGLPLSQYSTLVGATNVPTSSVTSSSSSTSAPQSSQTLGGHQSQPIQNPYPVRQTPKNPIVIDPALVNLNPYTIPTSYHHSFGNGVTSNSQQYNGNPHQYLQSPSVVDPAMLVRSPHGYSNSMVNRPASSQLDSHDRYIQNASGIMAEPVAQSPSTPGAGPSTPGTGSSTPQTLSPVWTNVLTARSINDAPQTTARSMISLLLKADWALVDCATRVDILTRIRDNAGKEFYSVWANDADARDILTEWLKTPLKQKGWEDTLMPLLSIIDRIPITVEGLKSSTLARVVLKAGKSAPNAAVKDLAGSIVNRWKGMIEVYSKTHGGDTDSMNVDPHTEKAGGPSKKRKLENTTKITPSVKKAAVGTTSAAKPVPTVVKKVVQPKETKPDLSFFTTKPKEKLPAFKRMVPKNEPERTGPAVNAFEEAMKLMGGKSGNGSVPVSAIAVTESTREVTPTTVVTVSVGKNGKAKKRVTFPPPERLVQIKLIERAIYDDDADGETAQHSSYRDLDIDEGHALHALLFEEQIDWYDPPEYDILDECNVSRGSESTERQTQTDRENSVLEAVYMSAAHVPDTPTELHPGMESQVDDSNTVQMSAGDVVSSLEEVQMPAAASLQVLLAKIASTSVSGVQQQQEDGGQWGGNASEDISWGAGHPDARQAQGWADHDDRDDRDRGPGGGVRRGQQRPWVRGNFPPGTRFKAPCKFYNGPQGRVPLRAR